VKRENIYLETLKVLLKVHHQTKNKRLSTRGPIVKRQGPGKKKKKEGIRKESQLFAAR